MTVGAGGVYIEAVTSETTKDQVLEQVLAAASAAGEKKATDVVILDVGDILAIADYFVIASGGNDRQVRAIVDEVEDTLKAGAGLAPLRIEGAAERKWVLMDYGDFWVHVFQQETRDFYDLERLWSDAVRVPFDEGAQGSDGAASAG